MSLATNLTNLATRAGTEDKALRTLINGNVADLTGLHTAATADLVSAINEVNDAAASATGINDGTTSSSSTWSSSKIDGQISDASAADRDRANHTGTQSADTLVDGTTNHVFTAADDTKLGGIASGATANQTNSYLLDRANHTGTQDTSTISGFDSAVNDLIQDVVGAAPDALNTLQELADALGDDANFAATVDTSLANRVRVDSAQAFDPTQQGQGRTNIGAASAADVGDASADPVAAFEAAL